MAGYIRMCAEREKNIGSISELRKICQRDTKLKNWVTDWYSVLVRKYISIFFTKFFLIVNITANQVTHMQNFIGVLGALLFISGNYLHSIAGVILLQFYAILDHVDGEVARCRQEESEQGKYLDILGGNLVLPLTLFTISIGAYNVPSLFLDFNFFHNMWILIFGGISSMFWVLINCSVSEANALARTPCSVKLNAHMKKSAIQGYTHAHRLKGKLTQIYFFFRIPWNFLGIVTIGTILNCLFIIPILYGSILPFFWVGVSYVMLIEQPWKPET